MEVGVGAFAGVADLDDLLLLVDTISHFDEELG